MKNYSIWELHNLLLKKIIKPSDIIKNTILKLKKNSHLNAAITIIEEKALKQAKYLDNITIPNNNYVFGIPYFAKDNFVTKDILTTASSKILSNFIPNYNAKVINDLSEKMMILLGKSTLDELSMGGHGIYAHTGIVLNPWDNSRIIGGSSSGSAALVASGVVPFALGSDTGDSIRKPASYAGIIGIKPTYGLISRYGLIPYAPSLDTVGYFTTNIKDTAIILDILAKKDINDSTSMTTNEQNYYDNLTKNIKKLKFVYIKEIQNQIPNPLKMRFQKLFSQLEQLGIFIKSITFSEELLKSLLSVYMTISYAEAVSSHSNLNGINFGLQCDGKNYQEIMINSRTKGFGDIVKKRYIIGAYVLYSKNQKSLFLKAQKIRCLIIKKLTKILNKYDILLLPASINIAPTIEYIKQNKSQIENIDNYIDNVLLLANLVGNPSITISFMLINNLPIGINLNSKLFSEQKLLNASYFLEELIGFKYLNNNKY